MTSYGNPDLSLLDQVTIHELIHGFNMPKGTLTGGPEMGHAFLVNDIADANDLPDRLYFTNGDTASVAQAVTAEIVRKSDTQYELTITPSAVGWNYGSVYDPTHGYAELKSIIRKSDGLEFACVERGLKCPFWQTDRTLRDGKDWLYEYCLHFVDDFATANSETYVLTFDALPETVLEVVSIETVPEEGKIAEEPIEQLTVTFNKAVDAATFTGDDITFAVQGAKKDATQIGISTEDNRRFVLDMTAMNDTLSNGYYTLSVQTANITDAEGYKGKDGKQVSWILYRGGLVCLLTSAYPHDAGNIRLLSTPADARCHAPSVRDDNSAQYGSTVTLNAEAAVGYEFSNWTLNGEVVGTEPTLVTTALGDMDIVANFSPKTYLVEIATEGSGGTVIGSGTGIYEHGTQLVLTALPDDDYMLKGWYINGKAVSETNETLGLQVDSTMTIKAVFEREYYRQRISLARGWNWVSSYIREEWPIEQMSTYANRIVGQFSELVSEPQFGLTGNLEHLTAGAAYKVEAMERFSTSFRGHLLTDPVKLEKGWNWVAYPWMETRTVSATITDAEEGDYLVSQHGFTEYADGYWEGSLRTLVPGEGYLYKSVSDKTLVYDFMDAPAGAANTLMSMNSSIDINAYPNTMNVTARLYEDGYELTGNDYILYAMNGDELRGVGEYVGSNHYITVYGDQPVNITFVVENSQTGAAFVANEQLTFCDDIVGSRQQPFAISIGSITGIAEIENGKLMIDNCVYDLQGRKVHANSSLFNTQSRKGIYIVNGHKVVNGKYMNR
ncbi:MAG: Ig-like domain-containing protein [Prevotella sp.]|nr:Ig-like domain-containing protein [Prevotella sp.]